MDIKKIDVKTDKNNNLYVVINYNASTGRSCKIVLNHYDLEYAMKGKVKYEISNKTIK